HDGLRHRNAHAEKRSDHLRGELSGKASNAVKSDRHRRRTLLRMTTRLFLVRHGETAQSAEDRFSGAEGVELSEEGRKQAARLGDRLRAEGISAVYSSPLSRAMETARIISKGWPTTPIAVDGLREVSHGHWEGLQRKEVEERFAAEYAMWEQD